MKTVKRIISILLVSVLTIGICTPPICADEKPYSYVAIGDSTCSGYNSDEFVYEGMNGLNCGANPRIYPNLMGQYLREALNREVDVNCILPEGIRAHDLRAVLDPTFIGDVYCQNHIKQWSDRYGDYASLHKTFCDAIAGADLLSIDVCMSSMGNYFLDRVKCALGLVEDKSYDAFYGADLLSSYLGGDYDGAIKTVMACRGAAQRLLTSLGIPTETVSKIVDSYEYSVGTLMINFSESVKKIYELNDDVQLIVMSPFYTTCYDLTLEVEGIKLSLESIMRLYISAMYNYILRDDPNHGRYKMADMYDTDLRCFTDAIADGEWDSYRYVTNEIRSILISNGVPVDESIPEQDEYFRNVVCKNVEKALADKEFVLSESPFDVIRILLGGGKLSLAPLVQAAADDYDNAPGLAKLALRISFVFESWGCHPDYSGHMQKFEAMRKVYEEPYSARDTYLKGLWDFIESFIYTLKHDLNVTAFIKEKLFGTILGIVTYDFRG